MIPSPTIQEHVTLDTVLARVRKFTELDITTVAFNSAQSVLQNLAGALDGIYDTFIYLDPRSADAESLADFHEKAEGEGLVFMEKISNLEIHQLPGDRNIHVNEGKVFMEGDGPVLDFKQKVFDSYRNGTPDDFSHADTATTIFPLIHRGKRYGAVVFANSYFDEATKNALASAVNFASLAYSTSVEKSQAYEDVHDVKVHALAAAKLASEHEGNSSEQIRKHSQTVCDGIDEAMQTLRVGVSRTEKVPDPEESNYRNKIDIQALIAEDIEPLYGDVCEKIGRQRGFFEFDNRGLDTIYFPIDAVKKVLSQVLADNMSKYAEHGAEIKVSLQHERVKDKDYAVLSIRNPIAEKVLGTSSKTGLNSVRKTMEKYGGKLEFERKDGQFHARLLFPYQ